MEGYAQAQGVGPPIGFAQAEKVRAPEPEAERAHFFGHVPAGEGADVFRQGV
jgi:hypothetical protein